METYNAILIELVDEDLDVALIVLVIGLVQLPLKRLEGGVIG